ncbi:unnamed protein product [Phytophthora lilii]|uniref:Unnamed protein product n=1 Tax=Phytophthora lilii TaxID=2077276 RepID=A0A9W6TBY6_9STRA|nr:unnamed protein product [Phytophthora lilii]
MEVLKTTAISEKAAAKQLKKFVDSKETEENADLMVRGDGAASWEGGDERFGLTFCADERGGQVPVGAGAGPLGGQEAAAPTAAAGRVPVRTVLGPDM